MSHFVQLQVYHVHFIYTLSLIKLSLFIVRYADPILYHIAVQIQFCKYCVTLLCDILLCIFVSVCLVAENRVVLRNANIVRHIVIFLAEQKYQELHVFAVILLASCVEDPDIVKVIYGLIILTFVCLQPFIASLTKAYLLLYISLSYSAYKVVRQRYFNISSLANKNCCCCMNYSTWSMPKIFWVLLEMLGFIVSFNLIYLFV